MTCRQTLRLLLNSRYVELLPYDFGSVVFSHPNNYTLIQEAPLETQSLHFELVSPRTIDVISLSSHPAGEVENDGSMATVAWAASDATRDADYRVVFTLSQEELGLFGFSTLLPDSLVADAGPPGFFASVIEPEPGDLTETISKVFTLIIDRSGSMSGSKIVQARNAARFIVEHLNEGDRFNIVDFSGAVDAFSPGHVDFNPTSRDQALSYIDALDSGGSTNISGAFGLAVPQFAASDTTVANIIVFFTDGMATAGLTNTQEIVDHVASLVASTETYPIIFNVRHRSERAGAVADAACTAERRTR